MLYIIIIIHVISSIPAIFLIRCTSSLKKAYVPKHLGVMQDDNFSYVCNLCIVFVSQMNVATQFSKFILRGVLGSHLGP
jgi:hypothetical protein